LTNLRVGEKVLQECIARAGSLEGGLKFYVGAGNMEADGGYAGKVLSEYARLYQVAKGRALPLAPRQQQTSGETGPPASVVPTATEAAPEAKVALLGQ
jgi:hypothetical protein